MHIQQSDLDQAVAKSIITADQAHLLWAEWQNPNGGSQRLSLVNLLYYGGAVLTIFALCWLMGLYIEDWTGGKIAAFSGILGGGFIAVAAVLVRHPAHGIPAGLIAAIAVFLTPVFTFGIQLEFDLWAGDNPGEYEDFHRWVRGGWFMMEVATIVTGLLALRYFRLPFLVAPIAGALWYMSMDLTPILFAGTDYGWEQRRIVSVWFGLAMILASYIVDIKYPDNLAFWGYFFGAIAFWAALSSMDSDSEWSRFGYFVINLVLIFGAVFLRRRIFLVFGALGVIGYLGDLARRLFPDSMEFALAIALLGLATIALGILVHRKQAAINGFITSKMPDSWQQWRPIQR